MKLTIILSIFFAALFVGLSEFFFWGGWLSYIFSPIAGILLALFIKRNRSTQIVPFILLAAIVYGLLGMLSVELVHVLKTSAPFDWMPILQQSAVNAVIFFIGGLIGIVAKGFSTLQNKV